MIGVTVALLLACSSFVFGILWVHWRADYVMLWQGTVSQRALLDALHYYTNTVGSSPEKYATVLVTIGTIQTLVLLFKMFAGKETNWLFDVIESLPVTLPPPPANPVGDFQETLTSLRDVASAHLLLSLALIGIVLLQCGKYYSERLQERERNEEVDARLVRRLRQLQHDERVRNGEANPNAAPSPGGPGSST